MGMENLVAVVMALGVSIFALSLVTLFLAKFDVATTDANASAALKAGMEGLGEFNNWWSLLAIASIFMILFAVLFAIARAGKGEAGGF